MLCSGPQIHLTTHQPSRTPTAHPTLHTVLKQREATRGGGQRHSTLYRDRGRSDTPRCTKTEGGQAHTPTHALPTLTRIAKRQGVGEGWGPTHPVALSRILKPSEGRLESLRWRGHKSSNQGISRVYRGDKLFKSDPCP